MIINDISKILMFTANWRQILKYEDQIDVKNYFKTKLMSTVKSYDKKSYLLINK